MRIISAIVLLNTAVCSLGDSPTPAPDSNCGLWEKGVSLTGHELSNSETDSAAECCVLCGKTVGASQCTGWTWNLGNHLCYLKTDITGNTSSACISGGVGPGPPLPFPNSTVSPTPGPSFCEIDSKNQCPWYNASLSFEERRDALVAALTPSEKLDILAGRAVNRLHVVADGFNEALHGVAWAGRATVFPCPLLLGATFNVPLVQEIGVVVGKEALAKHWGDNSNALSFFAPNINIVRDVRWGRAQETYGEDPVLTGRIGSAYVKGMQFLGGNTSAPLAVRNVAKHFAAYNLESNFAGRTTPAEIAQGVGQYRLQYDTPVSNVDLVQTFLPAWEDIVKDGKVRGVMCAYNSINGVPLCANQLMQDELRARLGFEGIVITDCGAIGFMTSTMHWKHEDGILYTPLEATAASLKAGTDLNCGDSFSSQLPIAYAKGLVTLEEIDKAVGRSMMGHLELGLFQNTAAASTDTRRKFDMSIVDSPEHRALAKQAAIEGMVLLKNLKKTLPVVPLEFPIKLAVLGPNANRTMSLVSNYAGCTNEAGGPLLPSCTFINPLQGIQAAAQASDKFDSNVLYAQGVDIDTPDTSGIAAAVALAGKADVVIVVGGLITCQEIGDQCQEAEARDRSTPVNEDGTDNPFSTADKGRDYGIGLPGQQLELLKALANSTRTTIVLVVMSGSAVEVSWAASSDRVGAIIQHFYPGVLGGEALADVLIGLASPGGKLPVMVPTGEDQLPADYLNQSMQAGQGRTHRYFTGTPLYPFGFGLSYSSFTYSNLQVSRSVLDASDEEAVFTVSVSIINNGEFAGTTDEVVMVFAKPFLSQMPNSCMSLPRQLLVGFAKRKTKAGQTVHVEVEVPVKALRLVGPDGTPGLLQGTYELHVGGQGAGIGVGVSDEHVRRPLVSKVIIK